MKTRKILALLTALVMVLGVLPGIAYAADGDSLKLLESYITSSASAATGQYVQDGRADRPYALSWAGGTGNGFRMGVLAFSAENLSEDAAKATLKLKVFKVQNINESNSTSTISVYAMDPTKVDNTNALKPTAPTAATKVGTISMAGFGSVSGATEYTANNDVSCEINLAKYFELYPNATTIALLLANRDDIADCNSRGLIGFYGINDAGNEPQLVPVVTTTGKVEIKAGGSTVYTEEIKGLVVGEEYTPDSSIAPEYLVAGDKLYSRSSIGSFTVGEDASKNVAVIEYEPVSIFKAFVGVPTMLPAEAATFADNKLETVKLTWSTTGDVSKPGNVTYTSANGISVQVEVVESEYSPELFYCSGSSSGANFGWKTDLRYTYSGGNAIFETVFNTDEGKNRLISYGNDATASFDGTGPIMRYMNAATFEYYDGGWKASTVPCEANKTYRLLTIVNFSNKTYQMYVAEGDNIESYEITDGPAKFRSQDLAYIDRFFYHGDGLEQGESTVTGQQVITAHYEVWVDGYTNLTVNYKSGNTDIAETKNTKWATGTTYTADEAPRAVLKDGSIHVLEDVTKAPSFEVTGSAFIADIKYHVVTVKAVKLDEVNTVVGQPPVMPNVAKVEFSDGQTMEFAAVWDEVDVSATGTKTATGRIDDIDMDVTCLVNVKDIVVDYSKANEYTVATNNGGWNWYVEPSGTHIQPGDELATRYESGIYSSNGGYRFQHDRTYMGWVEDDGTIVVTQYDHDTDEYKRVVIHEKLESDDHNNPAVVILPDGRIMAVYTMHTNESYMYFRVTKNPEDISEWHAEQFYYCETVTDMETNTYNATYPTIFLVHDDEGIKGNDVIYAGWRGVHWKPTLAKFPMPDENGRFGTTADGQLKPVMGQTQIANTSYWDYDNGGRSDSGRRPYTKYDYDFEKNLIYITFTANHPDNDVNNNIYYFTLDINEQKIYTAKGAYLQPLPKENKAEYKSQGAGGTSGQWGVETNRLVGAYPELLVFDANAQLINGGERRGWTWDIIHNDKGEPCIVYADITATPPGENGALPTGYKGASAIEGDVYGRDDSRTHHYYWYARWDSEKEEWVNTYLTYAGKWFHQNATQERCYSGGLTFDHNYPGNVIFLSIPTEGKYGNVFEIYRWETDDYGTTWTKREALTQDSPTSNARPNAIYNYKMNDDGTNAGPRLLWISGEYRYWMNYEYKTGVKTDFVAPGFITQDDPEMFAAVSLTSGGVELEKLPSSGNEEIIAKFNISNISIGDGDAKLALAHYGADGSLKGVKAVDEHIYARSVPQTSVLGADVDKNRGNGLSAMGEEEIVVEIPYAPESGYAVGDSVKLFAWNMGIERQLNPIMEIPYEISTSGSRYLFSDYFTYESDDKLVLTNDEATTYNGWIAKAYSGAFNYNDTTNYVALTKAPFGNTGLHIFRHGDGGLMVSHALPDTDGKDFTLEFTMRHIDEWSWNNTDNQGFTLSNGIPAGVNDATNSHSAFQYRYKSEWRDENGRGTSGRVRNSLAFDGGTLNEIFHNVDLDRDVSDTGRYERVDYNKGVGYYDKQEQVYIHDYNDALYTGSLFRIKVNVHPATEMIEMSVNDGYRTAYYTTFYNSGYDWENNPIDTITFSIGNEKWGEVYIDDFRMYLSGEGTALRNVTITPVSGAAMTIGSGTWNMLPMGDSYVFFDPEDSPKVMEVYSQSTAVGGTVGTWEYNGGDNQKFYLEDAGDGNYYIRGKQSGLYLGVSSAGAVTLQNKANATVFAIEDTGNQVSAAFVQLAEMIEDGTYIPTMDAILEE